MTNDTGDQAASSEKDRARARQSAKLAGATQFLTPCASRSHSRTNWDGFV